MVAIDNYRSEKSPTPFPSQATLAADTGMSERTVRDALHDAHHGGWVRRVRRNTATGARTTDGYELLVPAEVAARLPLPADFAGPTGKSLQTLPAISAGEVVKYELSREPETKTLVAPSATLPPASKAPKAKGGIRKAEAIRVFAYWRDAMGKSDATMFDHKRERRLVGCLQENGGDVSELLYAVDGALKDDWLMGRDPKSPRRYDGIEHIFRDRAQIERLCELASMNGQPHPWLTETPP